jgi:hypothetical protein
MLAPVDDGLASLVQQALAGARAGHRAALSWVLSGPRWETK